MLLKLTWLSNITPASGSVPASIVSQTIDWDSEDFLSVVPTTNATAFSASVSQVPSDITLWDDARTVLTVANTVAEINAKLGL